MGLFNIKEERRCCLSWMFRSASFNTAADITVIIFGRAATTPVRVQEMNDDWGGYFATMAQEEATAVFAFEELLVHLRRWDAPTSLQQWCAQIIQDEQRHTLMMSGLAHRNGRESAGSVSRTE